MCEGSKHSQDANFLDTNSDCGIKFLAVTSKPLPAKLTENISFEVQSGFKTQLSPNLLFFNTVLNY